MLRKAKARRDSDENLATMRAIVRRVYQRDYTARPDVPPVPAAEKYIVPDEPAVAEPPPPPSWLPVPEHIEVPPD